MEKHHEESIEKFLEIYKKDPSNLAFLLGGSIAHGFDKPDSDIDILILVDQEEFIKRKSANKLTFSLWDICTYDNGYIDCKIIDLNFLEEVLKHGSDAARYAFKDSKILYSRVDSLQELIEKISTFPAGQIKVRRKRFASQLLAWKWYYSEGIKKNNNYLLYLALQKIVLFSTRIILNENQLLYPYHKWMLEEVKNAEHKPEDFLVKINNLFANHTQQKVNKFCEEILNFVDITESELNWPEYFLKDSEQNWLDHEAPIDDI